MIDGLSEFEDTLYLSSSPIIGWIRAPFPKGSGRYDTPVNPGLSSGWTVEPLRLITWQTNSRPSAADGGGVKRN